jgi:hypothetical protein
MAADDTVRDTPPPGPPAEMRTLTQAMRDTVSLTRLQGVCATLAALVSIGGAFGYMVPLQIKNNRGEVLAIVQDRGGKPVTGATVELLTLQDALVTTVPPATGAGSAKTPTKEGTYRLRVMHPKYTTESRQIYVMAGQTAQIHVRLSPRPAPPPPAVAEKAAAVAEKPVENSPYENIKKLFR